MRVGMRLGPFWVSTSTSRRRRRRRPPARRTAPFNYRAGRPAPSGYHPGSGNRKAAAIVIGAIGLLLIIIGIATGGGKGTPTGNSSPANTASVTSAAVEITTAQPTVTKTQSPKTPTAVATSQAPAASTPAQTTPAAVAPPPSTAPASCYPLTNGGNCYEPGEFCRNSDHGVSGVAGDGENITCENNDGWRWEPA